MPLDGGAGSPGAGAGRRGMSADGLVLGTYGLGAFAGRRCIVTGAASGMGRAIALRLAQAGAKVALGDVREDALAAAVAEVRAAGVPEEPVGIRVDLGDRADTLAFVDAAVEAGGGLDHVVNVAGIGGFIGTVETHPDEDWDLVLSTNLGSVHAVCGAAVPHLRAAGGGSIVNFASAAAYRGS